MVLTNISGMEDFYLLLFIYNNALLFCLSLFQVTRCRAPANMVIAVVAKRFPGLV